MNNKVDCKIKLDILHGFGSLCSQGLRESVNIIDDDQRKILFPIGRYFALKSYDKSDEQFIKLPENTQKLICMTVSPNRKFLAASVQIKGDNFPQILIYNIKNYLQRGEREKIFRYTDTKSDKFVAISFSGGDARFLVCMTSEPDHQIIFLDFAKMKPLGYALLGHPISRLQINPKENHVISLSGNDIFKVLRVQENSFKQLNEISNLPLNQNFTDHAWLDESYLIIGTDKGTVYIVENYEVQEIFENSFNQQNVGISAICAFNNGFIIGSNHGNLALYMKIDEYDDGVEDYKFMLKRTFLADRKSGICHINISSKNDIAAVSFKSNDIATFELTQLLNQNKDNFIQKQKKINFDYLFNGFHSNEITSMDVCLQRPLIVTCSKYDSSIRVWNYINYKCELARKFYVGEDNSQQDVNYNPLLCVAFHPFGYYISAGFVDKIRFFHLLHSELRIYKEVILKNCQQMKFSNGGQYLAAAYSKNKTSNFYVNIYNSYSIELVVTLKGHTSYINDIQWDDDDQNLYTVGQDGNIYQYNTRDWMRKDYQQPNSHYQSMIFAERGLRVICGKENNKNIVREVREEEFNIQQIDGININRDQGQMRMTNDQDKYKKQTHQLMNTNLTSLTYINSLKNYQAIIGGCDQGFIRVYSSIFNTKPFEIMSSHAGQITKIRTSPDGRYVFSAGMDGTLFIYQVTEITSDGNLVGLQANSDNIEDSNLNPKAMIVDENLAEVVMVGRQEIDGYLNIQRQLRNEIENLENKIELKHYEEKTKLLNEKQKVEDYMHKQIDIFNLRYEELKSKKQEIEKDYNNLLKNMENNHLKTVEELENLYEKKLSFENEKFIQLESSQTEERINQKKQIEDMKAQNRKTLEILKGNFQDKFNDVQNLYKVTKQNAKDLGDVFQERLAQQEDEYEIEIDNIKQKQKKQTDDLKMDIMNIKSRTDVLQQQNKQYVEEIDMMTKNKNNLENQIEKLNQTIQEQNDRIQMAQKELKEREENLKKKEKKIYEYKYKISDLQKAKHVLSYRTAEMRKSLEPKEAQIEKLKEELFKLEGEFEKMLKTSQKQNDKIKQLTNQVETVQRNYDKQVEVTKLKENILNKIIMDIHSCVNSKDIKQWPQEMKKLYQLYVLNQEIKQVQVDPKGVDEMQRQVSHLENCIDQIHLSSNNIIKRRELDIRKKTMENAELIYDLNQIRKKNKEFDNNLNKKVTQLEYVKNEKIKLQKENQILKSQIEKLKQQCIQQNQIENPIQQNQNFQSTITLQKQNRYQQQSQPQIGGLQTILTEKKITHLLEKQNQKKLSIKQSAGKLFKGNNYDSKTLQAFDKARIIDLEIDLENGAQRILAQENEIKHLRQKIKNHIIDKGCNDISLNNYNDDSQYLQYSQDEQ